MRIITAYSMLNIAQEDEDEVKKVSDRIGINRSINMLVDKAKEKQWSTEQTIYGLNVLLSKQINKYLEANKDNDGIKPFVDGIYLLEIDEDCTIHIDTSYNSPEFTYPLNQNITEGTKNHLQVVLEDIDDDISNSIIVVVFVDLILASAPLCFI